MIETQQFTWLIRYFCPIPSLKLTSKAPEKMLSKKGKGHLLTINFQEFLLLVFGSVSFLQEDWDINCIQG